jgi:E3 ubiquitin-protein ligase UHRF1
MADDEPAPDPAMAELRRKIVEIEKDTTLSAAEKAVRRQQVMSGAFAAKGKAAADGAAGGSGDAKGACAPRRARRPCRKRHASLRTPPALAATGKAAAPERETALSMIDETLKCAFCFNLCERPVTVRAAAALRHRRRMRSNPRSVSRRQAPCQHNFCLGCFTKWVQQSKTSCPTCRASIPQSMRQNPRINAALVNAIRMVRAAPCPARVARRPASPHALRDPRRPSAASGSRPPRRRRQSWQTSSAPTKRSPRSAPCAPARRTPPAAASS